MSEHASVTQSGAQRPRRPTGASSKEPPPTPATPDGEDPWTIEELAAVRRELEEQAEDLRGKIDSAEASWTALQRDGAGEGAGDDQADTGSKTFEREHELSLANNSRDLLVQVQRALGRLDD